MKKSKDTYTTVYKVVRIEGRRRISAYIHPLYPYDEPGSLYTRELEHLCIRYPLGKVIRPKIGKIFAFDTLDNVVEFPYGDQIWECRAKNAEPFKGRVLANRTIVVACYVGYWKSYHHPVTIDTWLVNAPDGTVLCDSLTLIKRVR